MFKISDGLGASGPSDVGEKIRFGGLWPCHTRQLEGPRPDPRQPQPYRD